MSEITVTIPASNAKLVVLGTAIDRFERTPTNWPTSINQLIELYDIIATAIGEPSRAEDVQAREERYNAARANNF